MDTNLFAACVFCAGFLLGGGFTPLSGFSGEAAFGYTTLQRQNHSLTDSSDESDVTSKYVAFTARWTRPAAAGLGAGTPATEFRIRASFPNVHTSSLEEPIQPGRVVSSGSGRFETFSAAARVLAVERGSVEAGVDHRRYVGDDLVNVEGTPYGYSESRQLIAERTDYTVGWRHRFGGFELAGAYDHAVLQGDYKSSLRYVPSRGPMNGGRLEGRFARARWSGAVSVEGLAGRLSGQAAGIGGFVPREATASLFSADARVIHSFGRVEALLGVRYDESRLPFVALAPLGAEVRSLNGGAFPKSRTKEVSVEVALRLEVAPGILGRASFRTYQGTEKVTFADPAAVQPDVTVSVYRGGSFPFLQFVFGLSAEFRIGGAPETR